MRRQRCERIPLSSETGSRSSPCRKDVSLHAVKFRPGDRACGGGRRGAGNATDACWQRRGRGAGALRCAGVVKRPVRSGKIWNESGLSLELE